MQNMYSCFHGPSRILDLLLGTIKESISGQRLPTGRFAESLALLLERLWPLILSRHGGITPCPRAEIANCLPKFPDF